MKRSISLLLLGMALFVASGAAAATDLPELTLFSSIRGAVYEDVDGDGRCIATGVVGEAAVPDVDIALVNAGTTITLYTGHDGTYGLVTAAHGTWQVTARPEPNTWVVTSPNPLQVTVSPQGELVQTGVDFCVQRLAGLVGAAVVPTAVGAGDSQETSAGTLPALSALVGSFVNPSIISELLLTRPPTPQPAPALEQIAETPVEASVPVADWLGYLNQFRDMGGLAPLAESVALSAGSQWHSRYMVVNDRPIAHSEDSQNPLFDSAGDQAAKNGNIFATTQLEADYVWAVNFWISGPFHLAPILDPELGEVGFGSYREQVGTFQMAAVLDVRSALGQVADRVEYPLLFPGDGAATWVVRHSLYEWPDPVTSCSGYARPTGAPIVVQLGSGELTPHVTRHLVTMDGEPLVSCRFDETTYVNPDPYAQQIGRLILDERDAVVIIPRDPLPIGRTIAVQLDVNGETIQWSFETRSAP